MNGYSKSQELIRKFNRLLISYNDFRQANETADYLLCEGFYRGYPSENRVVVQALNLAAIVSYARPFSANRGELAQHNVPKSILECLSKEERDLHDKVIEDRDTLMAHSDSDELCVAPIILDTSSSKILLPVNTKVQEIVLLPENMEILRDASLKLREEVFQLRSDLEPEVRPFLKVEKF